MGRDKKMEIFSVFCVLVFLSAIVLVPINTMAEESSSKKVFSGKIYSGKKIDKLWKQWYENTNNSTKLKNETKEYKYYQFGPGNGKNQEIAKDEWWKNYIKDKNKNGIDDILDNEISLSSRNKFDIIVNYNHHPNQADIQKIKDLNLEMEYITKYIDSIFINDCSISDINKISQLNGVIMVEKEDEYEISSDVSVRAIKARESSIYDPNTVWGQGSQNWASGNGINIAILDTGVNNNHPSINGKYVAGYNAIADQETDPSDGNGHGTHCAGIAMGAGGGDSGTTYMGVAPDAKLIDVKVLTAIGKGSTDIIIRGVEWCIDNRWTDWEDDGWDADDGIDVMSMSLGGGTDSDGKDSLSRACNNASNAGLVVVAAMGNDAKKTVPAPAAGDSVIAVGAVEDWGSISRTASPADEIWYDAVNYNPAKGSNWGPRKSDGDSYQIDELKPDVVAPGANITAANNQYSTQTDYVSKTGTSMATPHVAGVVALMREVYGGLCPGQTKSILRKTAEEYGTDYNEQLSDKYNIKWGFGYVDAYEAVKAAKKAKDDVENLQKGEAQYIDPDLYDSNTNIAELPGSWGFGFIKLYNPGGLIVTDGPNVYPPDCPDAALPPCSSHSYNGNEHSDKWGGNRVNAEFIAAKGDIVGSTSRIGKNSAEGIGMAEPLIYGPSMGLFSPLLLTIENFESSIVLQNPTYDYVDATVNFYYLDGALAATEYVTDIPSHGSVTLNANNYLIGQSGNAEVIVTSGDGLVGFTKRTNQLTHSGLSEPLISSIETTLYHHPLGTCLYSPTEYFILQNPTSSTVFATIDFYTASGTYDGTLNIQLPAHSCVQIQDLNRNAEITVTSGPGLVGISIGEVTEIGIMMSAPLISNPKDVLISPYLEEIGSWDSYIIIHNPSSSLSDIEINFYNLDGTLACSDNIYDIPAHSTIILNGEDYKENWDEPHANAFITVTEGSNIIGCVSHMEPIYFIGLSTNLLSVPIV
jgi:subtilisin family serine protease